MRFKITKLVFAFLMGVSLSGCLGTVVGAAADVAIEVVKVPFKVVGAVIGAGGKDDLSEDDTEISDKNHEEHIELLDETRGMQ